MRTIGFFPMAVLNVGSCKIHAATIVIFQPTVSNFFVAYRRFPSSLKCNQSYSALK